MKFKIKIYCNDCYSGEGCMEFGAWFLDGEYDSIIEAEQVAKDYLKKEDCLTWRYKIIKSKGENK